MKIKYVKLSFPSGVILFAIFLLSIVALFWTKPGEIINGNDTTYPLNPVGFFQQRLYQWNPSIGVGIDFSHGSAGLFWHGMQALIALTGFPLWVQQKIFLFLLFNVLSFSFYFFISKLTKNKIAIFTGTIFYLFNSYLFNLWGNIQSSALCAYALIPLASGLFLQALEKPKNKLFWSIIFGISTIFLSAFGMNPGIMIVVVIYAVLFLAAVFWIKVFKEKSVSKKNFIKTAFLFALSFIIYNLFWLIPEFLSATSKGYSLNILSSDNRGWLDFVSANTSLFNVLRLQGEWMWYSVHKGVAYLPYAEIFKTNLIFVFLSLLSLVVSAIAVIKSKNRWVVFFALILIVGALASVGSKPPLGYLYLFLAEKTKLLSLLRAPWYKFGMLICLAYAVLTSFFIDLFKGKKQIIIGLSLCLLQLVYAFPLISGKIFPSNSALPFKFKVPDYVFEADQWLKDNYKQGNIIMLPRQGDLDYYSWGNSSSPFLNLLANPSGILTEPSWTVSADTNAGSMLKRFYDLLEQKDSSQSGNILTPLNVKYLFLKTDSLYDYDQDFGSPDYWRKNLDFQQEFNKENSFGQWEIYAKDNNDQELIYGSNDLSVVPVEPYLMADYFLFDNKKVVIEGTENIDSANFNLSYGSVGFPLKNNTSFQPAPVYIRFGADHILYPYIINKEKKILSKISDPYEKINNLMIFSSKRLLEAERLKNNPTLLEKLLADYSSEIVSVQEEFNGLKSTFNRREIETWQSCLFYLSNQKEILNSIQSEKTIMAIEANSKLTEEINPKLKNLVSTNRIKKFYIKTEKEGDYQGFLLNSKVSNSLKNEQKWKIIVNQQEYWLNLSSSGEEWIVLNKIPLEKGENIVELELPFVLEEELAFVVTSGQESTLNSKLPEISFKKINPAKYEVEVRGSENDFVLVFSQNYHFNWQAMKINEGTIDDAKHFRVNSYANGWLIEKRGNFKIELEYKNQKIYNILLLFTAGFLLTGLIYLSANIVKLKKNGK